MRDGNTINPRGLDMRHGNRRTLRDRSGDFPERQTERLARLYMGPDGMAEIREWYVPAPEFPTTPTKQQSADAETVETPSKTRLGPRTQRESNRISSLEHPDSPIARSEGPPWTLQFLAKMMDLLDPEVSQRRFEKKLEMVWLEIQRRERQEKAEREGNGAEQNVQNEVGGSSTSDPAPAVNAANQPNGKIIKYTVVPTVLESFTDQCSSSEPPFSTLADVLGVPWRYCTGPLNSDEVPPVVVDDENIYRIFTSDEDALPKENEAARAKENEDAPVESNEDAPANVDEAAPAESSEYSPVKANEDTSVLSDPPASVLAVEDAPAKSNEDAPGRSD